MIMRIKINSITKKLTNCVISDRYVKFEKSKISYLLEKTLVLSTICNKCKNEDEKIFEEEESIKVLTVLGLIENI